MLVRLANALQQDTPITCDSVPGRGRWFFSEKVTQQLSLECQNPSARARVMDLVWNVISKEIWFLDRLKKMEQHQGKGRVTQRIVKHIYTYIYTYDKNKIKKQKACFSRLSGQPSKKGKRVKKKKKAQMSGFAFPFNKLFTGLWNRREACKSTKVSIGRERVESPGGEESRGPSLLICFYSIWNKRTEGGMKKKIGGKKWKSFVDFAAAVSFFLDMIHDISAGSGEVCEGWRRTWVRACVLESVRN